MKRRYNAQTFRDILIELGCSHVFTIELEQYLAYCKEKKLKTPLTGQKQGKTSITGLFKSFKKLLLERSLLVLPYGLHSFSVSSI